MNTGKWLIVFALLIMCIGIGMVTTPAFAQIVADCTGQPDGTPCDDSDSTTVSDQCISGVCTGTPAIVFTTNNNFTMQNATGDTAPFGGTNDVVFAWDGTKKTSVAISGQVSNANIFSPTHCLFFGGSWSAHDVAVYGPGTYTVYTGCPAGQPGCGIGPSYTFTVMQGQLGVHLLWDWFTTTNIDVVDVWDAAQPYGLYSGMWTGACGSNSAGQVWDWMSTAWYGFRTTDKYDPNYGNVVNGAPMLENPFPGDFANFNVMVSPGVFCTPNPAACTDNNVCTIDYDATSAGPGQCPCLATPVPIAGCCNTAADCSDNNACTGDQCVNHACIHTIIAIGCVTGADCNDGNVCTVDTCVNQCECIHTPIAGCCNTNADCNDNNVCTTDYCNPTTHTCSNVPIPGCCITDAQCNDNNICTVDTCNTATHMCTNAPIANCCNTAADCNDNNVCTLDFCTNNVCTHVSNGCVSNAECNDNNVCTTDTCAGPCGECIHTAITGCCNTNADCNDNNVCTTDSCNTTTHLCTHTIIAGCECFTSADCNDNNVCTTDTCTVNGCVYTAIVPAQCNDNNICTTDGCTNNACTHVAIAGCCNTDAECNDNNACTIDTCVNNACAHSAFACCLTNAECDDNNLCTMDTCDPTTHTCTNPHIVGCCLTNADCNDNNICTTDTCNTITHMCVFMATVPTQCNDNNICTLDGCTNNACTHTAIVPASCNDNNICTTDGCTNNACTHTNNTLPCDDGLYCNGIDTCSNGICTHSGNPCAAPRLCSELLHSCVCPPNACNDNNPCTTDFCDAATLTCVFTQIAGCCTSDAQCNDNNVCTADTCNLNTNTCNFAPIANCCTSDTQCNDNNVCTIDSCNTATHTCAHTPIANCCNTAADCDDNNCVTLDACVNNVCIHTPIANECASSADCYDGNPCTLDKCVIGPNGCGACSNTPIPGCCNTDVQCNDNNVCTTDFCNTTSHMCNFAPIANCCTSDAMCNDNNACTIDACVNNACAHTAIAGCYCNSAADCNDLNVCTSDTCVSNACVHTAIAGCCLSNYNCNDNNVCTTDSCVNNACVHTPIPGCCNTDTDCNDNNICTTDTCLNHACTIDTNVCPAIGNGNNNFTMLYPDSSLVSGTNDVSFYWDGTTKTSVAVSGQVSNALIFSPCPFFGTPWTAHDVTIYSAGTYTVYTGCPAGSPGCGSGAPITFTVNAGELGVHMLFDWSFAIDIDIVNVWAPNSVSPKIWPAPDPIYGGCGSNATCAVWQWMSRDVNGDGISGTPMVDGPFAGLYANFNIGAGPVVDKCCDAASRCNDGNACTTDVCDPASGACSHIAIAGCCNTATDCDDNNACTTDTCVNNVCMQTPIAGCCNTAADCNDNDMCTIDTCVSNKCVHTPTVPTQCNDNNVCTTDGCTANACTRTNNTLSCDDGLYCNGADTCFGGVCVHAGNPCGAGTTCNESTDHCDPNVIADCTGQPAGTACTDNNACTTNDQCVTSGKKMICQGTVVADGMACEDGNLCTTGDTCQAGKCTGGTAKVCEDDNPCTKDSCDPASGNCVFTPKPMSALVIGGETNETTAQNAQIQTLFTVTSANGCVMDYGNNYIYVTPGATLSVNCKMGTGPNPTTIKLNGVNVPTNQQTGTIICPNDVTTYDRLYLDNLKAKGGLDTDNIAIRGSN